MPVTFEFFQYIERLLCYSQFSNSTSDNGALLAAKGANIRAIPGCTEKKSSYTSLHLSIK